MLLWNVAVTTEKREGKYMGVILAKIFIINDIFIFY
jgi:hypothetical protein